MKFGDFFLMGMGGVFVVFFMMMYFVTTGAEYGHAEGDVLGNISLGDYNRTIEDAQDTAETFENIFNQKNIILSAGYLVIQGIPSATKTAYHGTIDSVKLIFTGTGYVFGVPAIIVALGIAMSILVIIFIITNWDWIRGIVPGLS